MIKKKAVLCLLILSFFLISVSSAERVIENNEGEFSALQVNNPPGKPILNGPSLGKVGVLYTYTVCAVDIDGDKLHYCICWGDGCNMSTCECFDSGEECYISHMWEASGAYNITVKAMDEHNCFGECSDPLPVVMPKTLDTPFQQFFKQLFDWFFNIMSISSIW